MEFERGLTKFRDVFLCLKDIRRWGIRDRIEETGLLEAWREELEETGDGHIHFEIELWFRNTASKRQEARESIEQLVLQLGGTVLSECIITEIAYHALLAEIPPSAAHQIIEHPAVSLMECDSIMFLRPSGQTMTEKPAPEYELLDHGVVTQALPSGHPIVAILDGYPLANHSLLANRLIIEDPDNYAAAYTVPDRMHGTAMASLIVHGDLSDGSSPLSRPVYVRPIMQPIPWFESPCPEQIPNNVLVVDHIHRAVKRMFEGEGTAEASAPTVRIINFSIGDRCRPFAQFLSPLAKLLDWLSVKYRVLFIISAGNHCDDIKIGIPNTEYDRLPDTAKEETIVKALFEEARHRRILAPAESINGVTVGALHHDSATLSLMGGALNLFGCIFPSPISAFGGGYRRAIKPDLLFNGGRVLFNRKLGTATQTIFESQNLRTAPGNKVAAPSTFPGDINKTTYCCGTSNATALISRMAAACHDTLTGVFDEQAPGIELSSYIAPLLKAMIIHGCSWGEIGARLQAILQTPANRHQIRNWVSRWLGYGVPDKERVLTCTEQRATLLGFGQLGDEEAHLFTLPLPPSLGSRREWRRLTVTLAWLAPIAANTQKYRGASLWFEFEGGMLAPNRLGVDSKSVRRGTVQHEVFEGDRAITIANDAQLTIKVNCRIDAIKIQERVAYGLAVSLEVAEGIDIAIYDEIRTRVASAIEIRARGET